MGDLLEEAAPRTVYTHTHTHTHTHVHSKLVYRCFHVNIEALGVMGAISRTHSRKASIMDQNLVYLLAPEDGFLPDPLPSWIVSWG